MKPNYIAPHVTPIRYELEKGLLTLSRFDEVGEGIQFSGNKEDWDDEDWEEEGYE